LQIEQYLLVGLGNPGKQYQTTRHNLGFMVVDEVARLLRCQFAETCPLHEQAEASLTGQRVTFMKPMTFMNRSGVAVRVVYEQQRIRLENLLVIVDDFHLPFGKMRFRPKGSDGGHNGLASVIESLGTDEFSRLRVGIGHPDVEDKAAFVLSDFGREEKRQLPALMADCAEACLFFVRNGITKTMRNYN